MKTTDLTISIPVSKSVNGRPACQLNLYVSTYTDGYPLLSDAIFYADAASPSNENLSGYPEDVQAMRDVLQEHGLNVPKWVWQALEECREEALKGRVPC